MKLFPSKNKFFLLAYENFYFILILLSTLILPYFLYSIINLSLYAGTLINIFILFLYTLKKHGFNYIKFFVKNSLRFSSLIFIIILIQSLAAFHNFGGDFNRLFLSLILLIFFTFGSYLIALNFESIDDYLLDFYIKAICIILTLILIFGLIMRSINSDFLGIVNKQLIFFHEPSHFILVYSPVIFYTLATANYRFKLFIFTSLISLSYLLESTTMFFMLTLGLIFLIPIRFLYYLVGSIILFLTYLIKINCNFISTCSNISNYYLSGLLSDYHFDRFFLTFNTLNLSAASFLSGWEKAYLDFIYTSSWGVGFQQFGLVGPYALFNNKFAKEMNLSGPLNYNDGGSIAPKLISEFGLLGILTLLIYLLFFSSILRSLSDISFSSTKKNYKNIFFQCIFVTSFIDIFIRGTGYFNPPVLLLLAACIWFYFKKYIYKSL